MNIFCVLGTLIGAVSAGLALKAAGADNIHNEVLQVNCEPISLYLFIEKFHSKINPVMACIRKEDDAQQAGLWWTFLPPGLLQLVSLNLWRVSVIQMRWSVIVRTSLWGMGGCLL